MTATNSVLTTRLSRSVCWKNPNARRCARTWRGGATCAAGVRDAQSAVALFGASTEGPAPSSALRRRVLATAGAVDERRWDWRSAFVAAAATSTVACLILFYTGRDYELRIASLQQQIAQRSTEAAATRGALAVLQGSDTREVTFGGEPTAPPRGRVFVNPSSGILLIASNLPPAPSGKAYEMWILPKTGNPLAAGLFASSSDGSALHLHRATVPLTETAAIAVTLEVAAGVSAPTSTPVIVPRWIATELVSKEGSRPDRRTACDRSVLSRPWRSEPAGATTRHRNDQRRRRRCVYTPAGLTARRRQAPSV